VGLENVDLDGFELWVWNGVTSEKKKKRREKERKKKKVNDTKITKF